MDRAHRSPLRRGLAALALTATVVVAGMRLLRESERVAPDIGRSAAPTASLPAASTGADVTFAGAWEGQLVDPSGGFPIRI